MSFYYWNKPPKSQNKIEKCDIFDSVHKAIQHLSSPDCKLNDDNSTSFKYKILLIKNGLGNEIKYTEFTKLYTSNSSVLIAFESMQKNYECQIFWKIPRGSICLLKLEDSEPTFSKFCIRVIMDGINFATSGTCLI